MKKNNGKPQQKESNDLWLILAALMKNPEAILASNEEKEAVYHVCPPNRAQVLFGETIRASLVSEACRRGWLIREMVESEPGHYVCSLVRMTERGRFAYAMGVWGQEEKVHLSVLDNIQQSLRDMPEDFWKERRFVAAHRLREHGNLWLIEWVRDEVHESWVYYRDGSGLLHAVTADVTITSFEEEEKPHV